jgi:hypothetical protein
MESSFSNPPRHSFRGDERTIDFGISCCALAVASDRLTKHAAFRTRMVRCHLRCASIPVSASAHCHWAAPGESPFLRHDLEPIDIKDVPGHQHECRRVQQKQRPTSLSSCFPVSRCQCTDSPCLPLFRIEQRRVSAYVVLGLTPETEYGHDMDASIRTIEEFWFARQGRRALTHRG